jgi:hypothetical protein
MFYPLAPPHTDIFRYFKRFHHFLPILVPTHSPTHYHELSPFLFFAILSVASRAYSPDPALRNSLSKAINKLAWENVSEQPLSLYNIQALLIISLWPSTTVRLWSDVSMAFVSIAMTAALHIGLHRPEFSKEYARRPKFSTFSEEVKGERMITWAGCNVVAQL